MDLVGMEDAAGQLRSGNALGLAPLLPTVLFQFDTYLARGRFFRQDPARM